MTRNGKPLACATDFPGVFDVYPKTGYHDTMSRSSKRQVTAELESLREPLTWYAMAAVRHKLAPVYRMPFEGTHYAWLWHTNSGDGMDIGKSYLPHDWFKKLPAYKDDDKEAAMLALLEGFLELPPDRQKDLAGVSPDPQPTTIFR